MFNSTGYVDDDHDAVAILTDGSPGTYGSAISSIVTSEARQLMPGGHIDDPAAHRRVVPSVGTATSRATKSVSVEGEPPSALSAVPGKSPRTTTKSSADVEIPAAALLVVGGLFRLWTTRRRANRDPQH